MIPSKPTRYLQRATLIFLLVVHFNRVKYFFMISVLINPVKRNINTLNVFFAY